MFKPAPRLQATPRQGFSGTLRVRQHVRRRPRQLRCWVWVVAGELIGGAGRVVGISRGAVVLPSSLIKTPPWKR